DVPVELEVESTDGPVTDGAVLHLTDVLRIRVRNSDTGSTSVYVNVLDLGIAGRISVLNQADGAGVALAGGEHQAIGADPGGGDPGLAFRWPADVPMDRPRFESVLAIFSSIAQDLRGLNQEGVNARARATVADELARLVRSGARDVVSPLNTARYAI